MHPGPPASVELVLGADRRLVIRKRAADPAARARLRHEHDVLERFRNPGAVAVVNFTDDAEATALTLQWAGPRTLSDIANPTFEEAAGVVAALATTVADAHETGVVHGRLDRSHVIIDESGRPVLCGWGGASFVGPGVQADGGARPADDVADLGHLLTGLIGTAADLEPIPERWRLFRRQPRWSGYQRRALLTLADQAIATNARVRPTARRFAAAVMETVPDACPMPLSDEHASTTDHEDDDDDAAPSDPRSPAGASGSSNLPPPATTFVHTGRTAAPPEPRSEPSADRDQSPTSRDDPHTIDPNRSPSAGVIGSRSETLDHRDQPPYLPSEQPVRPRLGERWRRRRRGKPRRWMPVAVASLLAVLSAVVIGTLLRSRPLTIRSSPRRAGGTARPVRRSKSEAASGDSTSPTTDPSPSGRAALSPSGAVRPSGATSTTTSLGSDCHPSSGTVADVDGDGCPETVHIVGNVLITPLRELAAGQRGDQVVLGDWWCRDRVTPAVLRPTTGEVFVFGGWPQPEADITITPTTTVAGATGIEVDHRESCDVVRVQRAGRRSVDVRVPREVGP